jgi:acyl-CoA thioesterase-1
MWQQTMRMFYRKRVAAIVVALAGLSACGQTPPAESQAEPSLVSSRSLRVDGPVEVDAPRVVVLGDSLTTGLGLVVAESYPSRLQERLDAAGYHVKIVSAGVSGDTTAGGLRRLEWALDGGAEVLVVALGGKVRGIEVLLAGMEAPPNFGDVYTAAFRDVFHQLAREHDVVLVPFLLEGVAGVPNLNQSDGIHPNAEGAVRVAEHVWLAVEPLIQRVTTGDGQ